MTDPQELRSIDELFRNTFNNLPDAPADSGWDTPSEHVWQQVRNNIQTPPPSSFGMSLFLIIMVAMQAGVLILPMLFSTPKQTVVAPASQSTVTAPVPATLPQVTETTSITAPATPESALPSKILKSKQVHAVEKAAPPTENVNHEGEILRPGGAAPLPGSNTVVRPNTTEERKAERARQLEQQWHKPLELLPVPKDKKAKQ